MDTNLVLNAGFNELVFEKRHKNYGAYQIRKRYRRGVVISALLTSALFLSGFGLYFLSIRDAAAFVPPKNDGPVLISVPVTLDQKIEEPKIKKQEQPRTPPVKGSPPNATPQIVDKPVDQKLKSDTIGNEHGVTGGSGITKDTATGGCVDCLAKKDTVPPQPVVVDIASDPPTFKGDIDVFFHNNIRYPIPAKEQGVEGTVWLSWIVGTNGEVEDVQVVKGANPLLDREALRVAKQMPSWNPGKDKGTPVKFRYRKPIRFQLSR